MNDFYNPFKEEAEKCKRAAFRWRIASVVAGIFLVYMVFKLFGPCY
jgi:hypothetical protein